MSSSIPSSSLSPPEPSSASASTTTDHASTAPPPAPSTATSLSSPQDHHPHPPPPPPPPLPPQVQHGAAQAQDHQQPPLPHPPTGGLGLGLVPHPDAAPVPDGAAGPSSSTGAPAPPSSQPHQPPPLQRTLPRPSTQREIDEARAAVVASLGNMLDRELSSRAAALHANDAAIAKQRRDVERSTAALRRENDRLAKEADGAARRLKEVGNVQNWAELLEKDFLVLEETLRLAREGGASDSGSSWTGSSWSGSRTPSLEGSRSGSRAASVAREACPDDTDTGPAAAAVPDLRSVPDQQKDAEGDITMGEIPESSRVDKGKGREIAVPDDGRSHTHAPEDVGT